ncbi:hypothetical protein MtrunA17_Chr1g0173961 [Medicago truncatula]|uniref:Uncharacterized protein n=1 Tax=Medicago truncatula TaxID=3880 RepID=A0A396JP25_MEDTR|nr:hypothetical protein MtrunA17_Chr1g0173961 [Medicago truncatula]
MITSDASDVEEEPNNTSSDVIMESVSNQITQTTQTPISTNNQPSTSLAIQPIAPTKQSKIPSPPTIFIDSTLLSDVCENIYKELTTLIKDREELIHKDNYEHQWNRLKERVGFVMSALKKTCVEAQDEAQLKFQNWLKGIDQDLKKVKVLRTWVQSPPCLRGRNPIVFIPAGVHLRELDLTFL